MFVISPRLQSLQLHIHNLENLLICLFTHANSLTKQSSTHTSSITMAWFSRANGYGSRFRESRGFMLATCCVAIFSVCPL